MTGCNSTPAPAGIFLPRQKSVKRRKYSDHQAPIFRPMLYSATQKPMYSSCDRFFLLPVFILIPAIVPVFCAWHPVPAMVQSPDLPDNKRAARQKRPSAPISAVAAASATAAKCVPVPRPSITTVSAESAASTGTRTACRVKNSAAIEPWLLRTLHTTPTTLNQNRHRRRFFLPVLVAVLYSNVIVGELKTQ